MKKAEEVMEILQRYDLADRVCSGSVMAVGIAVAWGRRRTAVRDGCSKRVSRDADRKDRLDPVSTLGSSREAFGDGRRGSSRQSMRSGAETLSDRTEVVVRRGYPCWAMCHRAMGVDPEVPSVGAGDRGRRGVGRGAEARGVPERRVAPEISLGAVVLRGVIWTLWRPALGAATALAVVELGAAVGGERRVRERIVASVDALLRAARAREAMGSPLAR